MQLTLNQIYTLTKLIQQDEVLQNHFELGDYDNIAQTLKTGIVSTKQLNYIYYLIFNNKRFKLNDVLIQIGFKQKI